MKKLMTTLSALALATTLSFAQDKPAGPPEGGPGPGGPGGPDGKHKRPNPEEAFKKLDANGDGAVSLEEFKAHRPPHGPGGPGGPGGKGGPGGPGGEHGPGGQGGPGGKGPGGKGPGGQGA